MYEPIQETLKILRDEFRRAALAFPPLYHDQVRGENAKLAFKQWQQHRHEPDQDWQWWHGPHGPNQSLPETAEFEEMWAEAAAQVTSGKGLSAEEDAALQRLVLAALQTRLGKATGGLAAANVVTGAAIEVARAGAATTIAGGVAGESDAASWFGRFYGHRDGMEEFKRLAEATFLALNELGGDLQVSGTGWAGFLEFIYELAEDYPTPLLRTRWEMNVWTSRGWYTGIDDNPPDNTNLPDDARRIAAFRRLRTNLFSASVAAITMILDPEKTLLTAWDSLDPTQHSLRRIKELNDGADTPPDIKADDPSVPVTSDEPTAAMIRNAFRRDGERWTLEFFSGTTPERTNLTHMTGYSYYAFLLRNPRKPINCSELSGERPDEVEAMTDSFQAAVETADRPRLRKQKKKLEAEREDALKAGAAARAKELDAAIASLTKYLAESETPANKPRRLGAAPRLEQIRRKVRQAMLRCREHLKEHAPQFCRHLELHVQWNGPFVVYAPATSVEWNATEQ